MPLVDSLPENPVLLTIQFPRGRIVVSSTTTHFASPGGIEAAATNRVYPNANEWMRCMMLPANEESRTYSFRAACSRLPIIGTNAKGFLTGVLASSCED